MSLAYVFRDPALYAQALTHPSWANEHAGEPHNQRLEFLGDAVAELIVSEMLLAAFPDWNEGKLSKGRAEIVNTDNFAYYADALGLRVRAERGLTERGIPDKARADAFEAVVAAVFVDSGGLDAVRALIAPLVAADIAELPPDGPLDPVSRLQQHVQATRRPVPVPAFVEVAGGFEATLVLEGVTHGPAFGRTKKRAHAAVAVVALAALPATSA